MSIKSIIITAVIATATVAVIQRVAPIRKIVIGA